MYIYKKVMVFWIVFNLCSINIIISIFFIGGIVDIIVYEVGWNGDIKELI